MKIVAERTSNRRVPTKPLAAASSVLPPERSAPAPSTTSNPAPSLRKPAYMPYGDAVRVLGTMAVVVGHVCDMIIFNPQAHAGEWWICLFFDSACRWAVPVYIMLSGALLLDPSRAEAPEQFYWKRLARLGVPVFVWSAFFMWFSVTYTGWRTTEQVFNDLLMGKPYAHLHFVFRIAGLYAFTPMLRVFLQHASRKLVTLTVVVLLCLGSAHSVVESLLRTELNVFLRFAPFLGFYLLGYMLRDVRLTARQMWGCAALAGACTLLLTGGTGLLVQTFGFTEMPSPSWMLFDFLSPVRVAFAIAVWLLLTNLFREEWLGSRPGRFVALWLAPATLGIYLVHPAFREILHLKGYTAVWPNVWIGIPLVALLVYIPSVLFTLIVLRIPYVRRIVG